MYWNVIGTTPFNLLNFKCMYWYMYWYVMVLHPYTLPQHIMSLFKPFTVLVITLAACPQNVYVATAILTRIS